MHSVAPQEAFPAAFPHPTPGKIRNSLRSSLSSTRTPAICPTQNAPPSSNPDATPTPQSNAGDHSGVPAAKPTLTLMCSRSLQPSIHYDYPSLSSSILRTLALQPRSNDATIPPTVAFPRQRASSGHKVAVRPCFSQGGDSPTERYPRMTTFL